MYTTFTSPFITPDYPKYLYRVQHNDSFSKYVVGTGVVATHHNPKLRGGIKNDGGTLLGDQIVDPGNKKASALDLLNHMDFYSKETTSCISTSSSLEFAIFWSHKQHEYPHTGVRIFVIDVKEVKSHQQVFHAWTILDTLQDSKGGTLYSEESLEKSRKCAKSFHEWIVTVHIPNSAIIRILPYEIVYKFKPNWYPPSQVPISDSQYEIKRYSFWEWKMFALFRKGTFTEHQRQVQVIKFIRELAKDEATFAEHAFAELFRGEDHKPKSFTAEALAFDLQKLSQIECHPEIEALTRTLEQQDACFQEVEEDASSASTSSSDSDDQGYPESVSDSASDLGLEKTFEKLHLKKNSYLMCLPNKQMDIR